MPTLNLQVNDDLDDGYWYPDGVGNVAYFQVARLYMGAAGNQCSPIARFTSVSIPAGATITDARFSIKGNGEGNPAPTLTIYADLAAASARITTESDASTRTRTTHGVSWTVTLTNGVFNDSPNIAAVIQELVDTYGSSLTTIHILMDYSGAATGNYEVCWSYWNAAADAPKLTITYTEDQSYLQLPQILDLDLEEFEVQDRDQRIWEPPLPPAACQGPNNGSTFADDASVGTVAWSNPGNAQLSDDVYAAAIVSTINPTTHYLKATGFNFSIPTDYVIEGIQVDIERHSTVSADITDNAVRLVKAGNIGTTDRASGVQWPTTDAYQLYGSPTDLWGDTWSPLEINGSGFGVAISATSTLAATADIDHIRITVCYRNPLLEVGLIQSTANFTDTDIETEFELEDERGTWFASLDIPSIVEISTLVMFRELDTIIEDELIDDVTVAWTDALLTVLELPPPTIEVINESEDELADEVMTVWQSDLADTLPTINELLGLSTLGSIDPDEEFEREDEQGSFQPTLDNSANQLDALLHISVQSDIEPHEEFELEDERGSWQADLADMLPQIDALLLQDFMEQSDDVIADDDPLIVVLPDLIDELSPTSIMADDTLTEVVEGEEDQNANWLSPLADVTPPINESIFITPEIDTPDEDEDIPTPNVIDIGVTSEIASFVVNFDSLSEDPVDLDEDGNIWQSDLVGTLPTIDELLNLSIVGSPDPDEEFELEDERSAISPALDNAPIVVDSVLLGLSDSEDLADDDPIDVPALPIEQVEELLIIPYLDDLESINDEPEPDRDSPQLDTSLIAILEELAAILSRLDEPPDDDDLLQTEDVHILDPLPDDVSALLRIEEWLESLDDWQSREHDGREYQTAILITALPALALTTRLTVIPRYSLAIDLDVRYDRIVLIRPRYHTIIRVRPI